MKLKPTLCAGIVAAAAISRIVPHVPNFTPIGALALFAGASFEGAAAFAIPLAAMVLSDAMLGFRGQIPSVYLSFILTVWMGKALRPGGRRTVGAVGLWSFLSSLLFYLATNFEVWAGGSVAYPHTLAGLAQCYVLALPFFGYTLAGTAVYSAIMFGAAELMLRAIPERAVA